MAVIIQAVLPLSMAASSAAIPRDGSNVINAAMISPNTQACFTIDVATPQILRWYREIGQGFKEYSAG